MTSNALTNLILLAIPRDIPGARAWRSNQGGAYPMAPVQAALRASSLSECLAILRAARPVRFGLPGLPDIDGFLPTGQRLGVEIKVGRDKLSADQLAVQKQYNIAGCVYVVATDGVADPVGTCLQAIRERMV